MRIVKWLDKYVEESIMMFFTTIMLIVVLMQIFMRFVMNDSLAWSEELARFCFIWIVFIGVSYGVKHQRHIKVDLLLVFCKAKGKLFFDLLSNLLFLGFGLLILVYGLKISFLFLELNQTSPGLKVPMGLVYMAAPIGMGLASLRIVQNILNSIRLYKESNNLQGKNQILEGE